MTRRGFGKLFSGFLVGIGLKSEPVLTVFPWGTKTYAQEIQENLDLLNHVTLNYIYPNAKEKYLFR